VPLPITYRREGSSRFAASHIFRTRLAPSSSLGDLRVRPFKEDLGDAAGLFQGGKVSGVRK
jgi:hypothetical protein